MPILCTELPSSCVSPYIGSNTTRINKSTLKDPISEIGYEERASLAKKTEIGHRRVKKAIVTTAKMAKG